MIATGGTADLAAWIMWIMSFAHLYSVDVVVAIVGKLWRKSLNTILSSKLLSHLGQNMEYGIKKSYTIFAYCTYNKDQLFS